MLQAETEEGRTVLWELQAPTTLKTGYVFLCPMLLPCFLLHYSQNLTPCFIASVVVWYYITQVVVILQYTAQVVILKRFT